ncbi:MAG TPA: ABC transporter ATP-binding protein [Thermotogota bacterium]|nr:ABC transporter ATP-binding protein [Thermotogota bacterium]HPJ88685.1 ABC transporter ATP-binding protein [Thermotogota bacterium]HPR95966.1 ABC transporter ATP-binding protein [Thermotogota bacterium]
MPFQIPSENEYNSYAVVMKGIVKQFPKVLANDHVDLFVKRGEIHAVVGENGAGKSTLMNQLYGLYTPNEGQILINGKELSIDNPKDAIQAGIGMVHQHFMLVGPLTVAENIVLGDEPTKRFNIFDLRKARKEVKKISEDYGLKVDVDTNIEDLPVGTQQRVEILKTLYRGAEILILDEPTAVLTPQETEELFVVLRNLQNDGKTIIFITHKLNEVVEVSNNVTVMRGGKVTGRIPTVETNQREIANMMVGREVLLRLEKEKKQRGKKILEVKELDVNDNRHLPAVRGISFDLHEGEIVGIAGVAGNGQSELVEAITGLRKKEAGQVHFMEEDITNSSPKVIRELGMSHIAADRFKHAMIKEFSVAYNIALGRHYKEPFASGGFLNHKNINRISKGLIEKFDVRPREIGINAGNLSGGNQQKMVVAREVDYQPRCMMVAQPTRGLDIGAIEFIHTTLLELRRENVGMLLISMELEEILSLSDRIFVMYEGKFMGEVKPGEVSLEELGLMMAGQTLEEVRSDVNE